MKDILNLIIILLILTSCNSIERPPELQPQNVYPQIYPDYIGVTIPAEIAPMNFNITDSSAVYIYVKVTGSNGGELETGGKWAAFDQKKWFELTQQNKGTTLTFDVYTKDRKDNWKRWQPFVMYVSGYPLNEYGVTYRKIAPGFETFSKIGIYQRCLSTFEETPILEETAVNGQCLNCHYANRTNPDQFSLHIRGKNGGTLINTEEGIKYLNTKTDKTVGSCTYGYWHPNGRHCAYSINRIYQNFYVGPDKIIEPWDAVSDIAVLDTKTNELICTDLLMTEDAQTTPAFSADGSKIFFCCAPKMNMPGDYEKLKYSLCSISFDANSGKFGTVVDTLISASEIDRSICLPRPSYDGKYLMYCVTDYGTTPVNRQESDIWLMDLTTGEVREMQEINSNETDAYHNWSVDSHWFLLGSKREDHLYSLIYLSCIDDTGKATKPFLMPQYNPEKYYRESLYSFNAPDFTSKLVDLDAIDTHQLVMDSTPIAVKIAE